MAPCRVLIVDDHPIVREGLASLVGAEPDLEVCGQAESAREALAVVESEAPDLVLVYEDEISKADRILVEILAAHDKVLDDPEPVVKVHALNDSSVDFVVRPWARTDDYWDVYWDLTREVKLRFDREGISIPYPQRDVHLVTQPQASPAGGEPSVA